MNIGTYLIDPLSKAVQDISAYVTDVKLTTSIMGEAGRAEISYISKYGQVYDGMALKISYNGNFLFEGRVFKHGATHNGITRVTAYDNIRYLQYRDYGFYEEKTCSDIFKSICSKFKIRTGTIDESNYKIEKCSFTNETYYNMIKNVVDDTYNATGSRFIIRDNVGNMELLNINSLKTGVILGESNLTGYSFNSSIDKDTYNIAKIAKYEKVAVNSEEEADDSEEDELMVSITYPLEDITVNNNKWGPLQYFEIVNLDNKANMTEYARMILQNKGKAVKTLTFTALGDIKIRAGNGLTVKLPELERIGAIGSGNAIVTGCTHSFSGNTHIMDLEVNFDS